MKPLKTGALCVIFLMCFYTTFAQHPRLSEPDYDKAKLFADLPQSLKINIQNLESIFSFKEAQAVSVPLGGFLFQGTVVSKSHPSDNKVQSIVIKSTNRRGSAFTFTKITNGNGSFSYKGRIISREHSDAYELQVQNEQYILTKKQYLKLINE